MVSHTGSSYPFISMNPPNPTSRTELCMVGFTRRRTRRRSQCRKMKREAAEEQQYIPLLSQDIIMEILSRLPIHSLFQCTLVSKAWRDIIIRDPTFSSMQHNRALENQNNSLSLMLCLNNPRGTHLYLVERGGVGRCKFTMLDAQLNGPQRRRPKLRRFFIRGSCNGLLFITFPEISVSAYVLNPITRECLMLPIKESYRTRIAGFGFHPARNEYKVLRVAYEWFDNSTGAKADILTLGTNAWRQIEDVPLSCMEYLHMPSPLLSTVLVNGCLHWCSRDGHIVALDMGDEKFGVVTTPDSFNENPPGRVLYHLMVWKGYLTVVQWSCGDPSRASFHIWVMKEYNVKESWTKQVNVKWPTWSCGIIHNRNYWPFDDESFIDDIEFIDHPRFKARSLLNRESNFRVMQHVGSLLSLKTVAGEERVQDIRFLPEL